MIYHTQLCNSIGNQYQSMKDVYIFLQWWKSCKWFLKCLFTARCTLVQSAVLRSHVVCLSVRPSVTLVNCDHIGWNSSKLISPLVSLGCSLSADPNIMGLLQGEHPTTSPSPQNGGSIFDQHTQMAISLQRVIRSTSCLVIGWGFRGRRI